MSAIRRHVIGLTGLTLLAIAAGTASMSGRQDAAAPEKTEPAVKVFEVVARRYAFEPATIEVNEGDRVRLLVQSADGLHGVGIKQFGVNTKVPRPKQGDDPVTIEFVASAAGRYPILCSEYCGSGHKEMTGTLIVNATAGAAKNN